MVIFLLSSDLVSPFSTSLVISYAFHYGLELLQSKLSCKPTRVTQLWVGKKIRFIFILLYLYFVFSYISQKFAFKNSQFKERGFTRLPSAGFTRLPSAVFYT